MEKHCGGFVVWLTGLPAAGKTTIATLLAEKLCASGLRTEMLDGDMIRRGLSKDLGFNRQDREENVRRIAFVADLLSRNGIAVIVAAVSPYRSSRAQARSMIRYFVEVYVECPLHILAARDPKGLYRRALAGDLPQFTGISDPYEVPSEPELTIHSSTQTPLEGTLQIMKYLIDARHLSQRPHTITDWMKAPATTGVMASRAPDRD